MGREKWEGGENRWREVFKKKRGVWEYESRGIEGERWGVVEG